MMTATTIVSATRMSVPSATVNATARCITTNLVVTILDGDAPFQITSTSGTLATGLGLGTHVITGPLNETNVNVTELGGDTENFYVGSFSCTGNLYATATCVGKDLQVNIISGDRPFQITSSSGHLADGLEIGTHIIPGPLNERYVNVTELGGETENFYVGDFNCSASSTPTTGGAGSTSTVSDGVELANVPANTYYRVLVKNGATTGFSGAVPASLLQLGVILAADVYRLDGGQSLTSFPNYSRVCLAGEGRLFYMDARQAPRTVIELDTEMLGDSTCGWIPAPGTVILTN